MDYEVSGCIVEPGTGRGIPDVVVTAYDKDLRFDDSLGEAMSDSEGLFKIGFDKASVGGPLGRNPDLYIVARTLGGKVLLSTRSATRFNASSTERYRLELPAETVQAAGLSASVGPTLVPREVLTTLTCLRNRHGNGAAAEQPDDLIKQIESDIEGKNSLLEVFDNYLGELQGNFDNNALPLRKMARLFEVGSVIDGLHGHYYGIAPGLRTGDISGIAAEFANVIGFLWGALVAHSAPWVGKSMSPIRESERRKILGNDVPDEISVSRGINHFRVVEHAPVNVGANALLHSMWQLSEASEAEKLRYGYERNGGYFVAYRAPSVYPNTPREVLRLNYRYKNLGNHWPLEFLIDELVEIAQGLYLGQLLLATEHLFETFDPKAPVERYRYQHFGYFLLFREWWNEEARRLFPHLGIPEAAISSRIEGPVVAPKKSKRLTSLTLSGEGTASVNPQNLDQVGRDLENYGSVVHMIRGYSDILENGADAEAKSTVLTKLHTLFNAGIGPKKIEGFYRGAAVSWLSHGLLSLGKLNSVEVAWHLARPFSPWTGKKFEQIDKAKVAELTEGGVANSLGKTGEGESPIFFGANTAVFRSAKERFVLSLAKAADIWMEPASPEERRSFGYEAKTFFFLARAAESINPDNRGKQVFQLNYRWPKLRNIPPDKYCIDELVQIADGFFLGQLFYAQDWLEPWSPLTDPSKYKYGLYCYFVLMDEEWHALRLKIGFDPYDV